MIPNQLAKSGTEHAHQVALFAYCAVAYNNGFEIADMWAKGTHVPKKRHDDSLAVPALEWLHAIPNGGSRGDSAKSRQIRGGALKAEGVRSGVPDIFLPWPNAGFHGLYIEMKKPTQKPKRKGKGGMSEEQIKFKKYAQALDYGFIQPMDFNNDCYVNLIDLAMFLDHWLECIDPADINCMPYIP